MLLSRTASDVYWFGRHLERAESIARVVDQHTSMLVDLPVDIEADWSVLLGVTGATDSTAVATPSESVSSSPASDTVAFHPASTG